VKFATPLEELGFEGPLVAFWSAQFRHRRRPHPQTFTAQM
jgi:hypothetical protein